MVFELSTHRALTHSIIFCCRRWDKLSKCATERQISFDSKLSYHFLHQTAADTVIIYDSDWNPQNDLQVNHCKHVLLMENVIITYCITGFTFLSGTSTMSSHWPAKARQGRTAYRVILEFLPLAQVLVFRNCRCIAC